MTDLSTLQTNELVEAALRARESAYVPYSSFRAGAAVLTDDGEIHDGALVENLIFGLAMCAERVAVFHAVTHSGGQPVALAVAAPSTAGSMTYPCGPCLQVAIEFGGSEMVVIAVDPETTDHETTTIGDLAPGLPHRKNIVR